MAKNSLPTPSLGGANHVPLSPVSLVKRTALAYPDSPAIIDGPNSQSWVDTYVRCLRLAGGLTAMGHAKGSVVSVLCRNIPAAVELSYAVPMTPLMLNMINTRLDAREIAYILDHGEADVFVVDSGLVGLAEAALKLCSGSPTVILVQDRLDPAPARAGWEDYESFIHRATPLQIEQLLPDSENDAVALNYTSGTTGNPKGVVYHHRGAYLNGIGNALEWSLPWHPRYLWTLPLFHCNGWCFPWTIAAKAGANICLRAPVAADIVQQFSDHDVTHLCGAPIVLNMIVTELEDTGAALDHPVEMMVAGAPPPAAVLQRAASADIVVTHVYGLTEVYGPTAICAWREDWDALPEAEIANKKARQGVNYAVLEELSVRDPETLEEVPADGQTLGEVMFRGNVVMSGYLKDDAATQAAFAGGHFHSGDLGVRHPDGHVELKDRSKDIIISGGENISSIEVENVLYRHPAVALASVVAGPHEKWGETPVAFVELKPSTDTSETEIIDFCRGEMSRFKCPSRVIFQDLPRTSTGKVQKFELRKIARDI